MSDGTAQYTLEPGESTSRTLLERVQRHDPEAWRRFVTLYGPLIYRWTRRQGLREHDATDVVQEVFQAVAEHINRFQRRSTNDSLRGWLWTVTRNKIHDHFRRRKGEPAAAGGTAANAQLNAVPNVPEMNDEPADALTAELAHRAMQFIQSEFEPRTWLAFWRTAVEGRETAETATELGLTIGAVYKAKSRVLLRLRRELDGWLE